MLATVHLMLFAIVVRLFSASTTRDYLFLTMMDLPRYWPRPSSRSIAMSGFFQIIFSGAGRIHVRRPGNVAKRPRRGQPAPGGRRERHAAPAPLAGNTVRQHRFGSIAVGAMIFLCCRDTTAAYVPIRPAADTGFRVPQRRGTRRSRRNRKSSMVVMRVRVEQRLNAARGVHWRGVALTDSTEADGRRTARTVTLTPAAEWVVPPQS